MEIMWCKFAKVVQVLNIFKVFKIRGWLFQHFFVAGAAIFFQIVAAWPHGQNLIFACLLPPLQPQPQPQQQTPKTRVSI